MSNQPTPDWATQATDAVDRVAGLVRDKAVAPALTIARGIVYGAMAAIVAVVAVVLFAILAIRFLNVYIPGNVYIAEAIVGGMFFLAGVFVFPRRRTVQEDL